MAMHKASPSKDQIVRVLRLRLKDKHARALTEKAYWVNQVWNYCNELSYKVWQRERRFMSGYDFSPYTKGATQAGMPLLAYTVQAVSQEYAIRRQHAKKPQLAWRKSGGTRRSLGWIPFKAPMIRYRNGQLWMSGFDKPLGLWDSYGLGQYDLGSGSISEDSRGRWYINISVKDKKPELSASEKSVGIDLGLKDFVSCSDGKKFEAPRLYKKSEQKLATAQRANKGRQVKNLHTKIRNQRKDFQHKLSASLVRENGAIFIGNVNAAGLAKTKMAKSVLDAGWSQFRNMLRYKCDSAGVWFEEVNEAFSTVTCSACGSRSGPSGLKDLRIREWTCMECGTHHDRDVNAAKNILRRGRSALTEGV